MAGPVSRFRAAIDSIPRLGSNISVDLIRFIQVCCSPSGFMPVCYLRIPYSRKVKQE